MLYHLLENRANTKVYWRWLIEDSWMFGFITFETDVSIWDYWALGRRLIIFSNPNSAMTNIIVQFDIPDTYVWYFLVMPKVAKFTKSMGKKLLQFFENLPHFWNPTSREKKSDFWSFLKVNNMTSRYWTEMKLHIIFYFFFVNFSMSLVCLLTLYRTFFAKTVWNVSIVSMQYIINETMK